MSKPDSRVGPLALVAGGEGSARSRLGAEILESLEDEVLIVPTGAAFERPQRHAEAAAAWLSSLGASSRTCLVLSRTDAESTELAAEIRAARFIYLTGGSPLHIRSVLKDSLALSALIEAWQGGGTIVGASGGAMVLTDPMVDPRGGAFTVGLGLVRDLAVVLDDASEESAQFRRTVALSPSGLALVALAPNAGLIRSPDGTWRHAGEGGVGLFLDGEPVGLEVLAGKASI